MNDLNSFICFKDVDKRQKDNTVNSNNENYSTYQTLNLADDFRSFIGVTARHVIAKAQNNP